MNNGMLNLTSTNTLDIIARSDLTSMMRKVQLLHTVISGFLLLHMSKEDLLFQAHISTYRDHRMPGTQIMSGFSVMITKWTTDTDSRSATPQTDLLAESTAENTAALLTTSLKTSLPSMRAPMGQSNQTLCSTF